MEGAVIWPVMIFCKRMVFGDFKVTAVLSNRFPPDGIADIYTVSTIPCTRPFDDRRTTDRSHRCNFEVTGSSNPVHLLLLADRPWRMLQRVSVSYLMTLLAVHDTSLVHDTFSCCQRNTHVFESSTERYQAALYQADKLVTKLLRCFNIVACYVGYKYVRISRSETRATNTGNILQDTSSQYA